jgi:PmbA protein
VSNEVNVVLKSDDGKLPSDYGYSVGCHRADLLDAKTLADDAVRRAMRQLGQIKLPTKNRSVILDNRLSGSFLWNFIDPIMGRAIDQKQSYFLDGIGKSFGSKLLTVVNMPHIPGAMNSRAYDGEGMATRDRILFEGGILKEYCLSNYYARKLKLDVTSSMMTNIVMPESKNGISQEEMIKGIDDGILITDTIGGNKDAVRGDFSYGFVGIAIEKGELTTPVSEMNINGNFNTFWNRLSAIGKDVFLYSNFMTPSLRIDDVALTGA